MEELNNSNTSFNQTTYEEDLNFSVTDISADHSFKLIQAFLNETKLLYNNSDNNATLNIADWKDICKPLLDFFLLLGLILIMLAVGCEITWKNLYTHLKRPIGLFIGLFSQFGIMPLSGYCILRIANIYGLQAAGVLIISCCPGGALSNIFAYFLEGDLPLSVAMTSISTAVAMGMMPLNIWVYGRHFESENLVIPYAKMAMSLIPVTLPVAVGMLLKWKFPRIASFILKIGSFSSLLLTFVCIVIELLIFPNMFTRVSAKLYVVILILPIIGLTLGYALAALLQQNTKICKTVSLECGIQNVPVALTIIALSFPLEMQEDIVLLPWLYAFSMLTGCSFICFIYHLHKKYIQKTEVKKTDFDTAMKQVPLLNGEENGKLNNLVNGIKIEIKPSNTKYGNHNGVNNSSVYTAIP